MHWCFLHRGASGLKFLLGPLGVLHVLTWFFTSPKTIVSLVNTSRCEIEHEEEFRPEFTLLHEVTVIFNKSDSSWVLQAADLAKECLLAWLSPSYSFLYPPRNDYLTLDTFVIEGKKSTMFEFRQRCKNTLLHSQNNKIVVQSFILGDFAKLVCIQKCFYCCTIRKITIADLHTAGTV